MIPDYDERDCPGYESESIARGEQEERDRWPTARAPVYGAECHDCGTLTDSLEADDAGRCNVCQKRESAFSLDPHTFTQAAAMEDEDASWYVNVYHGTSRQTVAEGCTQARAEELAAFITAQARATPHASAKPEPEAHNCANHIGREAECPQAHVCECGAPLSGHNTIEAYCPSRAARFRPSAATLARFPEQYPLPEATPDAARAGGAPARSGEAVCASCQGRGILCADGYCQACHTPSRTLPGCCRGLLGSN